MGVAAGFELIAQEMCRLGATDADLARAFGVTRETVANWKVSIPDFFNACRLGKEQPDDRMEMSLYQRGIGYDYEEVRTETMPDGRVKTIRTTKHVPADVEAASRWLRNRRPTTWGNTETHIHVTQSLQEFYEQISNGPTLVELNERRLLDVTPEVEQTMNLEKVEDEVS